MRVAEFIKNSKSLLNEFKKIKAVVGNQSADLDSISSSISMSYFLTKKSQNNIQYFPIINSTKSIIQTKKECLFLFDSLSINLDDLIFLSDLVNENRNEITDLVLVDHNELDEQEKTLKFSNLVSGIVDHHVDKGQFQNADPRIVDLTAGSNCSLITDLIRKSNIALDESFATMLLYPILVDTNNLTVRASQKDIDMVKYLNQIANIDLIKLYSKLEELKFLSYDENESVDTILKKDYKQYEHNDLKWGMSSVSFCLKDWITKFEANFNQTKQFMNEKNLFLFAMLSCFKLDNGEFKRDLILFGKSDFMKLFELNLKDEKLFFIEFVKKDNYSYIIYDVGSVNLTRKYWQPVLETFLKSI
jgi:exopolyphosphatase